MCTCVCVSDVGVYVCLYTYTLQRLVVKRIESKSCLDKFLRKSYARVFRIKNLSNICILLLRIYKIDFILVLRSKEGDIYFNRTIS